MNTVSKLLKAASLLLRVRAWKALNEKYPKSKLGQMSYQEVNQLIKEDASRSASVKKLLKAAALLLEARWRYTFETFDQLNSKDPNNPDEEAEIPAGFLTPNKYDDVPTGARRHVFVRGRQRPELQDIIKEKYTCPGV